MATKEKDDRDMSLVIQRKEKMIVYHYSPTLGEGDYLDPGHEKYGDLCEPFMEGLAYSRDCFMGMLLSGKFNYAVMNRSKLRQWANYAKWATEGLFEYVRRKEYPDCVSRLYCNYYCVDVDECIRMFREDWGEEEPEEQEKVHLFEVELPKESLEKRDVSFFDAAYDAIEKLDVEEALALAKRYFAGEHSGETAWEYLSAAKARAVKDISHLLR